MTLQDSIVLAIVVSLLTLAASLAGQWLSDRSSRKREKDARDHADRQATADRLRDATLRDLAETRTVVIGTLDRLNDLINRNPAALNADPTAGRTRYNINLVGDVQAIRAYTDLVNDLTKKLPLTFRDLVKSPRLPPVLRPLLDPDVVERIGKVRAQVLAALDRQERRAFLDEAIVELTADEIASLEGGERQLLEQLRERRGEKPPKA